MIFLSFEFLSLQMLGCRLVKSLEDDSPLSTWCQAQQRMAQLEESHQGADEVPPSRASSGVGLEVWVS